ncbi:NeuD/PglB/VioB family sugar acetyltransferase [Candidatus Peregrinibacteria bacterium]|nr:NeuD/PglB/VioB family sugar acetyltransferase [Candidatus Peregrinibacteria bacterium]
MRKLAIVGVEKEIIELAQECGFKVAGIFDKNSNVRVFNLPVLGNDDSWERIHKEIQDLQVAIALDIPLLKEKLASQYGFENLATVISNSSYISPSATIQKGSLVQRGVKIMPDARIGRVCKLNVNATVHHDCVVGDFCTLAPGCMLLGAVIIEERVFIGAGAIILPKVKVGRDSIIGAGAVVVDDVPAGITVVGVPARPLVKEYVE